MKRFIFNLVVCLLVLSVVNVPVHAESGNGFSTVEKISSNTYLFKTGDNQESITVNKNDIHYQSADQSFDIIYDPQMKTLYSSLTHKTISLGNNDDQNLFKASLLSASPTRTYYTTKKISWHSIHEMVGNVASVASVAAVVLSLLSGVPETASKVAGLINMSAETLNKYVISNSKNHGLLIKIKNTDHYRIRTGIRSVYKTDHSISSITTY